MSNCEASGTLTFKPLSLGVSGFPFKSSVFTLIGVKLISRPSPFSASYSSQLTFCILLTSFLLSAPDLLPLPSLMTALSDDYDLFGFLTTNSKLFEEPDANCNFSSPPLS